VLTVADAWAREARWREVGGVLAGRARGDLTVLYRLALTALMAGDRAGHAHRCRGLLGSLPPNLPVEVSGAVVELCALSRVALDDWGRPLALAEAVLRWTQEQKASSERDNVRRLWLRVRGGLLHRAGRHAEAIAALTEAMKLTPGGQGEALEWAWLALAHAATGEKGAQEALRWLKRARQAAPKKDGDKLWQAVLVEVLLNEGRRVTRRFLEVEAQERRLGSRHARKNQRVVCSPLNRELGYCHGVSRASPPPLSQVPSALHPGARTGSALPLSRSLVILLKVPSGPDRPQAYPFCGRGGSYK
jgi:hypothetical protein